MEVSFSHQAVEHEMTRAVPNLPVWPQYGEKATNFVFRADKSYVEADVDRKEGVAFINTIVR